MQFLTNGIFREIQVINIARERLMTLSEAAKCMPRRRMGRPVTKATLLRWHAKGKDGIQLEVAVLPGGFATSMEALQRFIDRLTAQTRDDSDPYTTDSAPGMNGDEVPQYADAAPPTSLDRRE